MTTRERCGAEPNLAMARGVSWSLVTRATCIGLRFGLGFGLGLGESLGLGLGLGLG